MDIIVHGCTGRMGQVVSQMAREGFAGASLAARISPECPHDGADNCFLTLDGYTGPADCVVDFSHHTAAGALLRYCAARRLPAVIATTGHTREEERLITEAARSIPIFLSANMSLGVAVLAELAKKAAAMFPLADIEIVEAHHNQKLDAPSGTALLLARTIQEARPNASLLAGRRGSGRRAREEIGIHSLRLGSEIGTHEILISTGSETITLKHQAESRALFAEGALTAAAFLCGKPAGLYTMRDILA